MKTNDKKVSYNTEQLPNIDSNFISSADTQLKSVRAAIKDAIDDQTYSSPYASARLPFDAKLVQPVRERTETVGAVDLLVLIGVGGSSLGFRAVYEALQDQTRILPHNVLVLETVDTPSVIAALVRIKAALQQKLNVHVCVISKSGTTVETNALWTLVQPVLQEHRPEQWQTLVTIITDENSPLAEYAQTQDITVLFVPHNVGGRYSVFSPVGLLPLMLCGIDTDKLLIGAQQAIHDSIAESLQSSFAFNHAVALATAYNNCYEVHDTFIFSTWCATIGLWYRQLAAESLGKMSETEGMVIDMIPTVSVGSTDLHSIGQLYLSGAQNFWTTILIILHAQNDVTMNNKDQLSASVSDPLRKIMSAMVTATLQVLHERGVPYTVITLSERSPYTIGYLLQSYMVAIIYAGELLGVNPFDQPDVERYKSITRKLLGQ